eukprot:134129-Rhodomonas_salina.1
MSLSLSLAPFLSPLPSPSLPSSVGCPLPGWRRCAGAGGAQAQNSAQASGAVVEEVRGEMVCGAIEARAGNLSAALLRLHAARARCARAQDLAGSNLFLDPRLLG